MPFSHHSHSGQFCPGHARNTLEEMVQAAVARGFDVFALTEHIPRGSQDLYPEEHEAGTTAADTERHFAGFYAEALRLRDVYSNRIQILIGFETEWIRGSITERTQNIERLSAAPGRRYDFVVGSNHHVFTIPIDFDRDMYVRARGIAGGTDERLFEAYFDEQYTMLEALQPPVVGHFDLIRLYSDRPDASLRGREGVRSRIERNLDFIRSYGGILEINSAALRKGLRDPYPSKEACEAFMARGGKFTLSDDSHGIDQVGLNYHRVREFIENVGIRRMSFLERNAGADGRGEFERYPNIRVREESVEELWKRPFWRNK